MKNLNLKQTPSDVKETNSARYRFSVSYQGPLDSSLFQQLWVVSAVHSEIPYQIDTSDVLTGPTRHPDEEISVGEKEQREGLLVAHKSHNVLKSKFDRPLPLLKNWIYRAKFVSHESRLQLYQGAEDDRHFLDSAMPVLFLLCESNNCPRELEQVRWVFDKYLLDLGFSFIFEDKLEDDHLLEKFTDRFEKPLVFIMHVRNHKKDFYLMQDNVEIKHFEKVTSQIVEEFVHNFLFEHDKLVPLQYSQKNDLENQFKNLEVISGLNFRDLVRQDGKNWLIAIHEGKKEEEQAIRNFDTWAKTFCSSFSKLRCGVLNQIENRTPLGYIQGSPVLTYVAEDRIDSLEQEPPGAIPLETESDLIDHEYILSFLKTNYLEEEEMKSYEEKVARISKLGKDYSYQAQEGRDKLDL